MEEIPLPLTKNDHAVPVPQLRRFVASWLADGRRQRLSDATLYSRRFVTEKLLWYLDREELPCCGRTEIRQFLAYASTPDAQRWNGGRTPVEVKPSTPATYFSRLKTLFEFCLAEEYIERSPMERMKPTIDRPDQIQPFTPQQVALLLRTARKAMYHRREEAILLLLLDTGIRASELCYLRMREVDVMERYADVEGKGGKRRRVFFGRRTGRALWNYLQYEPREPNETVFIAERGAHAGEPLTRSGLLQMTEMWGIRSGIEGVRCSPHTFRHTFAVEFLRGGGDIFALQTLLGHTSLAMTRKYVAYVQADIGEQHRLSSPVDRLARLR